MTYPIRMRGEALAMIAAGATAPVVAARMGVDARTVYQWAHAVGGVRALRAPHRRGVGDAKRRDALALVARGLRVREAAREVGLPVSTIYGWIYDGGHTVRSLRRDYAAGRAGGDA
ncbi:MAG: helix-turn-helix domain-containing protein [Neomegalonema sp.]|nr:helix-turn-helix domain-containing protein [Neomegalonema sp.]